MPSSEKFLRDYVMACRPVIITNLYEATPIAAIRTLEAALDAFGQVKVPVRNIYKSISNGKSGLMTLREYFLHVKENPDSTLCVTEYDTPSDVLASFKLDESCLSREDAAAELFTWPRIWGDHDLMSNLFVAKRGGYAHLHYDGDHRHVLLTEVFGDKSFLLFAPSASAHLIPNQNFSTLRLNEMAEQQRTDLADAANGHRGVLRTGETLYIPALMWHYFHYDTAAMSFNVRFGRNRFGRFLGADNFHVDPYNQRIGSELLNELAVSDAAARRLDTIIDEFRRPSADRMEKAHRLHQVFRSIYEELVDRSDRVPVQDLVERRVEATALYLDFETLNKSRTRERGCILPSQRKLLFERIGRSRWSIDETSAILYNKFGKHSLESLTQREASICLQWPGWRKSRSE